MQCSASSPDTHGSSMRAFVAILAVVGAASAATIVEEPALIRAEVPVSVQVPVVPVAESNIAAEQVHQEHLANTRFFNMFTAPIASRDYLPMEKFGTAGLFEKPLIVAFKQDDRNEITAFLLRAGLKSLFHSPETHLIEDYLMTGPKKVGLMLSAARYMDLPEMAMAFPKLLLSSDSSLNSFYRFSQDASVLPVMLFVAQDLMPAARMQELFDLGQLSLNKEFVKISREVVPNFTKTYFPEVQARQFPAWQFSRSEPVFESYPHQFAAESPKALIRAEQLPIHLSNSHHHHHSFVPVYEAAIPHADKYAIKAFPREEHYPHVHVERVIEPAIAW